VYEDEPQGPLQRLAKVDNVMFQPHTGAATTHARQLNMEQCFRNVLEVLAHGRAPLTPVNEPESPKIGEKLPIAFPPAKDISLGVFAVAAAKPKL
jgi:phosphoglycerate dehydrogenase-like enzyme